MINYKENYNKWLEDNFFDEETREELSNLIDEKEIEDRFYRDLEFGTGGLRGVMGAGTNRMNKYTIAKWYYAERWCYMHHLKPLAMMIKGAIRIIWGVLYLSRRKLDLMSNLHIKV